MNTTAGTAQTLRPLRMLGVLLLAACSHAPPQAAPLHRDAVGVEDEGSAPESSGGESGVRDPGIVPPPSEDDSRLPRPSSWTRIVMRRYEDKATVAVFEAETTPGDARADLAHHLETAGYRVGPIIAEDTRGFARGDVRVVAVFAPIGVTRSRVSVAVLALH